ncbi:MAG: lactonase family protein [Bacteroidota bacterium]|nr:lactonase family protein [Bacteroidota bacterium]
MKKITFLKTSLAAIIMLTISSCSKNADKSLTQTTQPKVLTEQMMSENGANPDEVAVRERGESSSETNGSVSKNQEHYVYTETNAAAGNEIAVYRIKSDGSLMHKGNVASGGNGTGMGLGSQGAIALDNMHNWLFAVNAGSNTVSSFKVNFDGSLTLAYTQKSGGTMPVSLTIHGNLLYVLNHGTDNTSGYWVGANGSLTHIEGSNRHLSSTAVDAPQISFSPGGNWIIVTEKATNIIGTFYVNNNGAINNGIFTASVGATPFGFDFSRGKFMIVSNAAGGAPGAGSATSYTLGNTGIPASVNGAVPDLQAAPCWFATTKNGRFAYTTNTASNNVSSYYVDEAGNLYLAQAVVATTDAGPVDIIVSSNNYYVYELNGKAGSIGEYHRTLLGGLWLIGNTYGLPVSATGLTSF